MKRVWLLVVAGAGLMASAAAQCPAACPERRTVMVSAEGKASAEADGATIHVGYKVFGPDSLTAYATASQTSNAIRDALLKQGIAKAAMESSSQILGHTPTWELNGRPLSNEERKGMTFTVIQSWTVKVKPDQAADVLHTAIEAGANESGWIEWTLEDQSALRARASAEALEHAHQIALTMLKGTGSTLGKLVTVNESQWYANGVGYGSGMGVIGGLAGSDSVFSRMQNTPVAALAISSRRVEVKLTVSATYSIE